MKLRRAYVDSCCGVPIRALLDVGEALVPSSVFAIYLLPDDEKQAF